MFKNKVSGQRPGISRFIFIMSAAALLFSSSVFAQGGKGKIAGKIVEDATGEPLMGVNVVLENTRMGATTNEDGKFVILNIQPGKYSVSASMVGFGKITKTQVEVFIDRTTEVNFRLKDQSVQVGQVTITAEKPKIVKDQTATANTLDDEQIKAAPIEGIRGALDLQASFQKDERGNYSIRGSGGHDLSFQINGVEQITTFSNAPASTPGSEKANNSWKYDVNPLAVQQVQVISGGYTAEYGNAQAGIVKVVLKEGGPKISGEVRMEYRPAGQYHYGNYLYDPSTNIEWQTWGQQDYWVKQMWGDNGLLGQINKDLFDKIKAFHNPADSTRALDEILWAHSLWVKNHTPSDDNPLGVYDYRKNSFQRYMFGFGGPLGKDPNLLKFYFSGEYRSKPTRLPTPEKNQVYQFYNLSLTYQPFTAHKFKFAGTMQKYVGSIWSGSDDIRWSGIAFVPSGSSTKYLVSVDPIRTEQTVAQSLNWVYTINNNSFLDVTLSHQKDSQELPYKYLPSFDVAAERADSLRDPAGFLLKSGVWWVSDLYRGPFNFSTNYYQDSRSDNWNLSVDFTKQFSTTNMFKTGFKLYYWDMMNHAVNSSFQANTYIVRSGYAEYYHAYPIAGAFYIQDKMEYEGMIANVGVRGEAFNFQSRVAEDIFDPLYPGLGTGSTTGNPETVPSKTQYIIMPRIGISFPIGENTAFRIQYGHFASMPSFAEGLSQRTDNGWITRGNPDIEYKKTIQYEFGIQQVLNDAHRLDVSIYYNDRTRQVGTERIAAYTGSRSYKAEGYTSTNIPLYPYSTYATRIFGSTVGVEVVFERIVPGNWGYRLSYNLSQTTDGAYGDDVIYPDGRTKSYPYPEAISGNDRTHNFRGYLQYQLKENEGPELLGTYPFDDMLFGLTYTAQSGIPFTYAPLFSQQRNVKNNYRYPLESNFDFNIQKNLELSGIKLILGLRIMNLFDNKLLTPIDYTQDREDWLKRGVTMDNPADNANRKSYTIASFKTYKNTPRQVFFTVGVGI